MNRGPTSSTMPGRLGDASSTSIRRRLTSGLSPNPPRSPYSLSPYLTHEEENGLSASESYGRYNLQYPGPFRDFAGPSASDVPVEGKNKPWKERAPVSNPPAVSQSRSHEVETSSSPFHTVPLTPETENRGRSVQGIVVPSRSTIISLPPRLPTPDFSILREPLRQALVAPLNFFRSRSARQPQEFTNSRETSFTSRMHHFPSLLSHLTLESREETRVSEKPTFKLQEASSLPSYPVFWSPTAGTADGKPHGLGINLTVGDKEADPTFISDSWKWERGVLFLSVFVVFSIGFSGLLCSLLLWFRAVSVSGIVVITQYDLLLYITLASSMHLVTSVVGFTGTFVFSRTIILCYTVLLLPNAAALLVIGCVAYQRHAFSLSTYLSRLWADLDSNARDVIQGTLQCCDFQEQERDVQSALHYMDNVVQSGNSVANPCRDGSQDCRDTLFTFQQTVLSYCYLLGFSLLALQLVNLLVALLCKYRLNRVMERVQRRPAANRTLIQAHAQARVLLQTIEDLIKHGQTRARESTTLQLEAETGHSAH